MKTPIELKVPVDGGSVTAIVYSAASQSRAALILAHGAGAGQRSPFMIELARALAALGIDAITFNFPYTEQGRRLPDRRPVLDACYRAVVEAILRDVGSARSALFIGGKSMGGRIATHIAAEDASLPIAGLVLLGYPLHPPGRPQDRRDAHLGAIRRPLLCVQGSRDSFGTPAELEPVLSALSPPAVLHVVPGGDHSFKVPKGAAPSQAGVHEEIQRAIVAWMETRS